MLSVEPLNSKAPGPTFSNGEPAAVTALLETVPLIFSVSFMATPMYVGALSNSRLPVRLLLPLLLYKAPSPTYAPLGFALPAPLAAVPTPRPLPVRPIELAMDNDELP